MKKIALLGGSRFIGFHLLKALHREGHEVTLFNRQLSPPPEPFPKGVKFVKGDRNHPEDLKRLFIQKFDVVFDISGFTLNHVKPIIENYRPHIGHYIFLSSTVVYKKPYSNPLNENSPVDLTPNTYGGDKALVEQFLLKEFREHRFPVTIFRPHGVIGAHDASVAGLVFYRLVHSLPILIPKNSGRTSYLSVHDLVEACVLSMNNPKAFGSIYVVTGYEMITAQDFVKLCGHIVSVSPQIKYVDALVQYENYRYAKPKRHVSVVIPWAREDMICDNTKIEKELGMRFTYLETILKDILAWFKEDPQRLAYFSLRGEHYILRERTAPFLAEVSWELTDDLEGLVKQFKNNLKRVGWLKEGYFRVKRKLVRGNRI